MLVMLALPLFCAGLRLMCAPAFLDHMNQPQTKHESGADFLCGFSMTVFGSSLLALIKLGNPKMDLATYIFLSFVFVSVPTGIVKGISYLLFGRPCLVRLSDETTAGRKKAFCLHCNACICACFGYLYSCAVVVTCLTLGIIFWFRVGASKGLAFLGSAMFQVRATESACGLSWPHFLCQLQFDEHRLSSWHEKPSLSLTLISALGNN